MIFFKASDQNLMNFSIFAEKSKKKLLPLLKQTLASLFDPEISIEFYRSTKIFIISLFSNLFSYFIQVNFLDKFQRTFIFLTQKSSAFLDLTVRYFDHFRSREAWWDLFLEVFIWFPDVWKMLFYYDVFKKFSKRI